MPFDYIEIDDPVYRATCEERNQQDYVLVKPKDYSNVPVTLPDWTPEPCCLSSRHRKIGKQFKDMKIRSDDVWLATFPKSGTTWCHEMLWLICNDLDYEKAASLNAMERFPHIALGGGGDSSQDADPFQAMTSMPSPRLIKTHLPVALLPDQIWTVKPRIVYVRRNPKSVAVSGYHHYVSQRNYNGTMDEYLESLMKDLRFFSPYHRHVLEYHNLDYEGNILYLSFEDMKKDLKSELKRVCAFFNKTFSEEQLDTLAEHLSFDKMKKNKSVNLSDWTEFQLKKTNRSDKLNDDNYNFIRKGKSDGWKTELSAEQQQQLDEWTRSKVSDPEQLKLFQ